MRTFLAAVVLAGVLAALTSGAAVAAPSETSLTIGSKAQWMGTTLIRVPVTYTCPVTGGNAYVFVSVVQESTGGSGSASNYPLPCTGHAEDTIVDVVGGPFALGQALADGSAISFNFFDRADATRRIQIVP